MKFFRPPSLILVLLYFVFLRVWVWAGTQLPDQVASHFNGSGEPNGWMSRSSNQTFMLIFGLGFPLFVVVLCYVTRFLPASLINLPNKDHWLAPERRNETCDYLVGFSLWFACLALCFVTGLMYLIVKANHPAPPHLSMASILGLVGCFLAGTAIWVAVLFRHFKRD
jgi:XapX domain-containing protein